MFATTRTVSWTNGAGGAPLLVGGERRWTAFDVSETIDGEDFLPVGESFVSAGFAQASALGEGRGLIFDMRAVVDHAVRAWSTPAGA